MSKIGQVSQAAMTPVKRRSKLCVTKHAALLCEDAEQFRLYISRLCPIENRSANLERAAAAINEALKYRTPASAPLGYGTTQNNLGLVYYELAEVEDRAANPPSCSSTSSCATVSHTGACAFILRRDAKRPQAMPTRALAEVEDRAAQSAPRCRRLYRGSR